MDIEMGTLKLKRKILASNLCVKRTKSSSFHNSQMSVLDQESIPTAPTNFAQ